MSQEPQKTPPTNPREHPKTHTGPQKVNTLYKLGFVHRRNVFEPPEPKVDYPYYVFGTLEILILVKGAETIAT